MTTAPRLADDGGLRLPEQVPSDGPAWLRERRQQALEHLRDRGFPRRKDEAWRFTSVRDVVSTDFAPSEHVDWSRARAAAGDAGDDVLRVVVADGHPDPELPDRGPRGVTVRRLADVLAGDPDGLAPLLGGLAPVAAFGALNAASFRDGLVIDVEGAVATPLEVLHLAVPGAEPRMAFPRVVVRVAPGAEASLVERYAVVGADGRVVGEVGSADGAQRAAPDDATASAEGHRSAAHLTAAVTEVVVGAGARLDHTRAMTGAPSEAHLAQLAVRVERHGRYASHVVSLGGGAAGPRSSLGRVEISVAFAGEGAEATLDGVYHVDGADHVDHQLFVDHAVSHATSYVTYRGLLDGRGHAVFNAIGAVRPGTAGSAAHQENRNLLLSDDAVVDAKPHLEIEADDVVASHGTAIGALDEEPLFYLRSRGIPEGQARATLTFAFVQTLLSAIPHEATARRLAEAVVARLPEGETLRELLP